MQKMRLTLLGWLTMCMAFAQPGDYVFRFGDLVLNGDMDIHDLKYLGRNRETGLDEFLAVLVRFPDRVSNAPDPIYFVHFAYGGAQPTMQVLNFRTFRPLIHGAIPPTPRFVRLIYQPAVTWHDRMERAYWYLIIWPGFVYALREDFYKAPADAPVILWGRYYQEVSDGQVVGPAFREGTHLGAAWRPRGIVNTPSVSSILITSATGNPNSDRLLAIDRDGNIVGYWGHTVPRIPCEVEPCEPCGLPRDPVIRSAYLNPFGGFSSVTGLTPSSNVDEYAVVMLAEVDSPPGCWYANCITMPFVVRFGLDGQVRWAKFYRLFRQNGEPLRSIAYSPFWIVEDRASPTSPPNRLVFCTGYQPSQLWRVDRETGSPVWGFFTNHTYQNVSALPMSGYWLLSGENGTQVMQMNDTTIAFTGEYATLRIGPPPPCGDYGDRYFLGVIGGGYIVSADDINRALPNGCNAGSVFLPVIGFRKLGQQYNPCHLLIPPSFERGRICEISDWTGFSLIRRRASYTEAGADIRVSRLPLVVECSFGSLCEGVTHCENGVRWIDGDVAPYPPDPFNADLSEFGDCCVDDADLLEVLFNFGNDYNYNDPQQFKPGRGDVNCDGIVDDADLLIVLFNFGLGCEGGGR